MHRQLMEKSAAYSKWHAHKYHGHFHWALFLVASGFLLWSSFSLKTTEVEFAFAQTATFQDTVYVSGLSQPTAMAWAPTISGDKRLFVSEKAGTLRVIKNDNLLSTPFFNLNVTSNSERGLLGIAFDPSFATNRFIYVYYTRSSSPVKNRVSRFTADTTFDKVVSGSELVLLDNIPSDAGNHNGGAVHFGPDGKLYISTGDGGQTSSNSQSLNVLAGKILRINKDGSIPTDNPFVNTPNARGEIWAYGLRNPYTMDFDPVGGKLYINDVGQNNWEEINRGAKGANYGWPTCEGPQGTGVGNCNTTGFTYPIHAYNHSVGESITGAAFYRGSQFPSQYYGVYFFGDYVSDFIRQLSPSNNASAFRSANTPVDIRVGPDESLYYLSIGAGTVRKIQYGSGTSNPPPTPPPTPPPGTGTAPVGTINTPALGAKYNAGDTITYSGTATDAEQGTLPASAFSWLIALHHGTHTHPFLGPITGIRNGTFTIPRIGHTEDNVFYRITLTVTDNTGLKHESFRDVNPNKVNLTLASSPSGLQVVLNGQPRTMPYSFVSVVGVEQQFDATTPQTLSGQTYNFQSWSNAGARSQTINAPASDRTYTATFALSQTQPPTPTPTPTTCNRLSANTAIPTGFGASFNIFSVAREFMVSGNCGTGSATVTVGNGNPLTYSYNRGYYWSGTAWTPYTLSCSGETISGAWCVGKGTASVPLIADVTNVIGYTCQWMGAKWNCGCRDNQCSTSYWQLQQLNRTSPPVVTPPPSGGSGGGGVSSGKVITIPIASNETTLFDCEKTATKCGPGDTIKIDGGVHTNRRIEFRNLRGTAASPIRVINDTSDNARVTLESPSGRPRFGIMCYDCVHVIFDFLGGWQGQAPGQCGVVDNPDGIQNNSENAIDEYQNGCGLRIDGSDSAGGSPQDAILLQGEHRYITIQGFEGVGSWAGPGDTNYEETHGFNTNDQQRCASDHPGEWVEYITLRKSYMHNYHSTAGYIGPNASIECNGIGANLVKQRDMLVEYVVVDTSGEGGIKFKSVPGSDPLEAIFRYNHVRNGGANPLGTDEGANNQLMTCFEASCTAYGNVLDTNFIDKPDGDGLSCGVLHRPASWGTQVCHFYNNTINNVQGHGVAVSRQANSPRNGTTADIQIRAEYLTIVNPGQTSGNCVNIGGSVNGSGYVRNVICAGASGVTSITGGANIQKQNNLQGVVSSMGFVNAALKNFKLTPSSNARNNSNGVGCPSVDLLKLTRPQGGVCDQGAIEFDE